MYAGKLVECDLPLKIRQKLEGEIIEIQSEDWQKTLKVIAALHGVQETQTYGESIHSFVDSG